MKKYYTLLMMLSLPAYGQWDFLVESNGNLTLDAQIMYPINYNSASCQFTFSVLNNNSVDDVIINNSPNCGQYSWVILDGYLYQLQADFNFSYQPDEYSFSSIFDMGTCSTTSGNPILTGSPMLQLGGVNFQHDPSYKHKVFTETNHTFFQFNSANGDITCSNGVLFELPIDYIFKGTFE